MVVFGIGFFFVAKNSSFSRIRQQLIHYKTECTALNVKMTAKEYAKNSTIFLDALIGI